MKPLVFYDFEVSKENLNKVVIWKDKLDEFLEKVYKAGYNDGLKDKEKPVTVNRGYAPMDIPSKLTSDNYMFDSTRTSLYGSTGTEFKLGINNHEAEN